jgi:hypothetical protein
MVATEWRGTEPTQIWNVPRTNYLWTDGNRHRAARSRTRRRVASPVRPSQTGQILTIEVPFFGTRGSEVLACRPSGTGCSPCVNRYTKVFADLQG